MMLETDSGQTNLAQMAGLFFDCGTKDQYNLLYGARRLKKKLDSLEISHRYEEFPDTHSSIDYRLDESLPFLYKAISK